MKTVTVQNLRIEDPNDRWSPNSLSLTLDTNIFNDKQIIAITSICQQAALNVDFELTMTASHYEKPETDEEIAEVKAAKEAYEAARKQKEDERREELVAKVILVATSSDDPYNIAIQNAIDDLPSWDQSPVRKLLKARDLLTLV